MGRPLPVLFATLLLATAAQAEDGYVPPELPTHLRAPESRIELHNPTPFPDEQELQFVGDGPNGWVILGGILATGAAVSALVSAASHAQMKSADTPPSEVEGHRRTRNISGYAALGMAAGAGVSFGIAVAR